MDTSENESSGLRLILTGLVVAATILLAAVLYWAFDWGDRVNDSPDGPVVSAVPGPESAPSQSLLGSPALDTGPSMPGLPVPSSNGRTGASQPRENPAEAEASNFSQSREGTPLGEVDPAVRKELRAIADSNRSQAQKVAGFKSYLSGDFDAATQDLAVKHLSKLVPDDQYNQYLASELLDPEQTEAVRTALVQDVNARGRQVMMKVMLEIATESEHPLKDYAHQTLGRYLGDEYSEDPDNLRVLVDDFIRRSNGEL